MKHTDVTDWDSNYSGNTPMLLKKTQITTSFHMQQGGEGEFECYLSFYKLFPLTYLIIDIEYNDILSRARLTRSMWRLTDTPSQARTVMCLLYCTVLYCTVLYCTVLYCTVLYCTVLYCTVLYCTVLYCS